MNGNNTRTKLKFFNDVKRNLTGLSDGALSFMFPKNLQYKNSQSPGRNVWSFGEI